LDSFIPALTPVYLNAILRRYKQIVEPWEEDSGSLSANKIVQIRLIFGKQNDEYTTDREENEALINEPESNNNNLSFSEAIEKNQALLIIGGPGSGKSTSLKWIAYTYADKILNVCQKSLPIPIYLALIDYTNTLFDLIITCLRENGVNCDEETMKEFIKLRKFLFIIDGFDELEKRDVHKCFNEIKSLMAFSGDNKFVVASRKMGYIKELQSLKFKRLDIEELSDSQIELFIEAYLGRVKGSKLLKDLNRYNLVNEARNPLLLWFIILEFDMDCSQISRNKGMHFKNVIEHKFLRKWEKKGIPSEHNDSKYTDLKLQVLPKLAFRMIDNDNSSKIEYKKAKDIIHRYLKDGRTNYKDITEEILNELIESRILVKFGHQLSFRHKSFRDYFAALELCKLYSKDRNNFMKHYVQELWDEPIIFLIGIIHNPSEFIDDLIQPFWGHFLKFWPKLNFRLSLATRCIGADDRIGAETQQKVIEQLMDIIDSNFWMNIPARVERVGRALLALGEIRSEKSEKVLLDYFEKCKYGTGSWFCEPIIKALGNNSSTERAQKALLFAAFEHKNGFINAMGEIRLSENMTQNTALILVDLILDENKNITIRERAMRILSNGLVKNNICPNCIDSIIQIVLEDELLRNNAAGMLCNFHRKNDREKIITKLIYALRESKYPNIRANAAWALVYFPCAQVIKSLILALDDGSTEVRRKAVYVLGLIHIETKEVDNEISRKLLRLYSDENDFVRRNAIHTFGQIYGRFGNIQRCPTDEESSILISLLKDENVMIRVEAAEALGEVKEKKALPALIEVVMSEKYDYLWAIAVWAILQIKPHFSEVIKERHWEYIFIEGLYDDDINVRRFAIMVLGKIGAEKSLQILKGIEEQYEKAVGFHSIVIEGNARQLMIFDKRRDLHGDLIIAIRNIEARIKLRLSHNTTTL
jgi:HEAT repeat protein/energy-coupling factor transporter ATP-binding protein EcfA2